MTKFRLAAVALAAALLLLPAAARGHGSDPVAGVLVERHGDRLDGRSLPSTYQVVRPSGRAVDVSPSQDRALVGRTVKVIDGDPAKPGVQGRARPAGEMERLEPAAGSLATLVILVSLADVGQSITPDQARDAVFTGVRSASALFSSQSNGATRLVGIQRGDGDVVGPLALGVSGSGCPYDAIANAADSAAGGAGVKTSDYHHVIYVLPRVPSCSWAGLGQMPGRRSWTNGYLQASVIAHEVGHNRGAHHASTLRCTDGTGAAVPLSTSCSATEYGDPFDVMGLQGRLMSSFHRAQVGDLPVDRQTLAKATGVYPIPAGDGDALLLVPRKIAGHAVTEWFALERRAPAEPFDTFAAGTPITTGLSVRLVPALDDTSQTRLLDMTPSTQTFDDAMLQPGASFSDPSLPITIAVDGSGGNVQVTMPDLVDDVPPEMSGVPSVYATARKVSLSWWEATDDTALDRYEIERDGRVVATTAGTSYEDAVTGPVTVIYRVVAVDTSGNRAASSPATVTVPGPPRAGNGSSTSYGTGTWSGFDEDDVGEVRRLSQRIRRGKGAWIITLRLAAARATRMTASVSGRRIASSTSNRLTVRFRFPDRARRRTITVRASNGNSRSASTWTYR